MALIHPYSLYPSPETRLFRAIASTILAIAIICGIVYLAPKIPVTAILWFIGIDAVLLVALGMVMLREKFFSSPPKE